MGAPESEAATARQATKAFPPPTATTGAMSAEEFWVRRVVAHWVPSHTEAKISLLFIMSSCSSSVTAEPGSFAKVSVTRVQAAMAALLVPARRSWLSPPWMDSWLAWALAPSPSPSSVPAGSGNA